MLAYVIIIIGIFASVMDSIAIVASIAITNLMVFVVLWETDSLMYIYGCLYITLKMFKI